MCLKQGPGAGRLASGAPLKQPGAHSAVRVDDVHTHPLRLRLHGRRGLKHRHSPAPSCTWRECVLLSESSPDNWRLRSKPGSGLKASGLLLGAERSPGDLAGSPERELGSQNCPPTTEPTREPWVTVGHTGEWTQPTALPAGAGGRAGPEASPGATRARIRPRLLLFWFGLVFL